jgi:hypothetical protein
LIVAAPIAAPDAASALDGMVDQIEVLYVSDLATTPEQEFVAGASLTSDSDSWRPMVRALRQVRKQQSELRAQPARRKRTRVRTH